MRDWVLGCTLIGFWSGSNIGFSPVVVQVNIGNEVVEQLLGILRVDE